MAEKLTPAQHDAVYNRGGNLLVSAAAGSGKTKVLVDRLMTYLLDSQSPANIDDFLIITYTQAAAAELRGKIAKKLAEHIAKDPSNRHLQRQTQRLYMASISTVHSFCRDLLKDYAYRTDVPADFRVADENECLELQAKAMQTILDNAYATMGEDSDLCAFLDSQGLSRDDHLVPDIILLGYQSSRCHVDPDSWLESCLQQADVSGFTDASQTVWGAYIMEQLHAFLDLQIDVYHRCAERSEAYGSLDKITNLCRSWENQLILLRECTTWEQMLQRKDIDYGRLTKPKDPEALDLYETIKDIKDSCKKKLADKLKKYSDSSQSILLDISASLPAMRGLVSLVRSFAVAYERLKKGRRVLDFNDLEQKTLDLLLGKKRTGPTSVCDEIAAKFRQIMVDEYQDSNEVQDTIFRELTKQRSNCFMVGDVKQSIYQFRLADPRIFLKKYQTYVPAAEAVEGEGRKVLLSHNFRSSEAVIDAVNDVFSVCMSNDVGGLDYGDDEALRLFLEKPVQLPDPSVELYGIDVEEDTYLSEATFVADRIHQLLDGAHMVCEGEHLRPIQPEDIVILLRAPGSSGEVFRYALECKGIRCVSEKSSMFQSEEIEVLSSILQTVSNPLQDIPLIATLSSRIFAFTADDLARIRSLGKNDPFYCALQKDTTPRSLSFLELLSRLRKEAGMCSLAQLVSRIFALTRIDSVYGSMEDGAARQENLHVFYQLAVTFESSGNGSLDRFLEYLDALSVRGIKKDDENTHVGAVTIQSIHKSKGLEYPVVVLSGLSKRFNTEDLKEQVFCDSNLGLGLVATDLDNRVMHPTISKHAIHIKKTADAVSEELRILYVAMTRARDRLIMTYASDSLERELSRMIRFRDLMGNRYLSSTVTCAGEWVLLSAVHREEADEFFRYAAKPKITKVSKHPWLIRIVKADTEATEAQEEEFTAEEIPAETLDRIGRSLSFQYPHIPATLTPSKQTATQLKGRYKDSEAAEGAQEAAKRTHFWRKPSFAGKEVEGRELGTAVHAVMQYINYQACSTLTGVEQELRRLVNEGFISEECAAAANASDIADFFATELGRKLRTDLPILREFKFSILDDANRYNEETVGERVLLQGVVDCAMIEEDGITVLDFKTDRVTQQNLAETVERYRLQVSAYARALERIYEKKVKSAQLYFFRLKTFVEIL